MDKRTNSIMTCLQDNYCSLKHISINGYQNKSRLAILISDKIYFKNDKKKQRMSLCNEKDANPSRRYSIDKYICTQW